MNINIVCDYASMYSGNFIPSILFFANSISSSNNIIFSFPIDAKNRDWIQAIKNSGYCVDFFSRKKRMMYKDLRAICKRQKVDIVYFHFVSPALGKSIFFFSKTKLFFHIHSDFSAGKKAWPLRQFKDSFFNRFIKTSSVYIYVSQALFSKSKAKIKYYIPNGLVTNKDKDVFLGNHRKQDDNGVNMIANLESPVFLAFAWSPFVKGIDILVTAFSELLKTTNAYLVLVHGKNNGKEDLINFLHSNKIFDFRNIIFVPPIEEVYRYYDKCFCFVSSSRSEGFSYSVLEAISKNKSVIVSDIPGTSWAHSFKSVIVFSNGDAKSLKNAMNEAINTTISEQDVSYNASMLKEYSIDKWNSEVLGCFFNQGIKL